MSGAAKIWDGALWLVCCILYTGCISRFFGRHLKGGRRQEAVFGALYFGGRLLLRMWVLEEEVPYILYAACSHMLLGALVMAVFGGEKEKRLLAAVLSQMRALQNKSCQNRRKVMILWWWEAEVPA